MILHLNLVRLNTDEWHFKFSWANLLPESIAHSQTGQAMEMTLV